MISLLKSTLALIVVIAIGFALAVFLPLKSAPLVGVKGNLALLGVNIIDTISGDIATSMTVLTEKGRITEIVPSSQYQSRAKFHDVAAQGKYLIPGLWDMHTHSLKLSPQLHHPLFIRYGVTSVRDMSGCMSEQDSYWACPEDRKLWEQQSINGERVSPRYPLQSSYQTNGGNEVPASYPDFFRLANPEDAEKLVNYYAQQSVDFIKTYTELSAEQFDLIAEFSSRKGIAIAGHKPLSVSLSHALAAGLLSIEHGRLFLFECFKEIEAFRQLENPIAHYDSQFMREILQNQDREKCSELMGAMAISDAAWVPTLTTLNMSAKSQEFSFREDIRLKYIPYIIRKLLWEPDINRASQQGYDLEGQFVHEDFYATASAQVGLANRLGIKLLAGTDNIDTYVFTGASLHDELGMLVDAGLTPLEAIQTATINPATFSGLEHKFGSVEMGKRADLLILNENPLLDIRHSRNIWGVVFAGQYFDQDALGILDAFVVDMARSVRVNLRFLSDILFSPLMRVQLAD